MNTKTTIVHIISNLDVGGAERSLVNLVLGMDRQRFTNIIISLQDIGHWGPILQSSGISVTALHMKKGTVSFGKILHLYEIIKQHNPDFLQGWMYHANVLALLLGKKLKIPKIYWNIRCSIMDLSKYSRLTKLVFKCSVKLSKFADKIICNSKQAIQEHKNIGFSNLNWQFIPNGYDTETFTPNKDIYAQFRSEHSLPHNAIIIGMVARFDPMKDHNTFFNAAKLLAIRLQNVYFVAAGRGVDTNTLAIKDFFEDEILASRTILLGQFENVQKLYPAFDYLTLPSIFGEGFPNVVAEAMSCGVCCFVTSVGDSQAIIGDLGYKLDKKDPIALANSWFNAIKDNNGFNPNEIRQRIIDNFSIDKTIATYELCYTGNI